MVEVNFDEAATWIITGIVDSIRRESGELVLWFDGFDELQTVPIVSCMPEWLFKEEVGFKTGIPRQCEKDKSLNGNIRWGFFEIGKYQHLTALEAFGQICDIVNGVMDEGE